MKIIEDSKNNIKFEVQTRKGYTYFEMHPSKLANTFATYFNNEKEYWIVYKYQENEGLERFFISSEEYRELESFLKSHNAMKTLDNVIQINPRRIINPIMELEI